MPRPLPDHLPILDRRGAAALAPDRYEERELTSPVDLCDARGRLAPEAVGFSRMPLVRANLKGHPLRKKRWNFWNWIDPDFVFSVTLANLDYAAFCSVTFIDFESGDSAERMWIDLPGRIRLPEQVECSVSYRGRGVAYENVVDGRDLRVRFDGPAQDGRPIRAEFAVHRPEGQESLNVCVPWSATRFQLNSKHNTLPCEGQLQVGDRRYALRPERCHGVQDWGRGVWPRRSFWNWAVCSGQHEGRRIGVNVGDKWTTGTGSNENGILLDGRLHKIMEDVVWEYDPADDHAAWRVRTRHTPAIDLTLTPRHAHRPKLELGLLATGGVCAFGHWRGRVEVEGQVFEIAGLPGWAEEFAHRW
ncbi:MAG: DUF2804 domain-containing protein [Myxococcota bacterium]